MNGKNCPADNKILSILFIHVNSVRRGVGRQRLVPGVLRRKMNRLARRTQGYRKSLAMLVDSLALVGLKRGWIHHAGPCREYPCGSIGVSSWK